MLNEEICIFKTILKDCSLLIFNTEKIFSFTCYQGVGDGKYFSYTKSTIFNPLTIYTEYSSLVN
jgi:hypothetical protein